MTTIQERLRGWALNAQVDMYLHGADQDLLAAADTIDKLVEALERSERKLTAYIEVCRGDKELTQTVLPMAREALRVVKNE